MTSSNAMLESKKDIMRKCCEKLPIPALGYGAFEERRGKVRSPDWV